MIDKENVKEYAAFLVHIKKLVKEDQVKAIFAVNKELVKLYWHIGKIIADRQENHGWGSQVVEKLAQDLQKGLPELGSFSRANVFRMQAFYKAYEKVQQPVRQIEELPVFNIPWGHNVILLQKLKVTEQRLWYAQQAIDNGWSRSTLDDSIQSDLYSRENK